ncbi:L-threonylcarbamoyladenylate synthase [Altericista sp. CCNU0014]|uniref:L-threonylcarbamoyladenylate synthase n=1 Tax=Altericista sp. CCNU0014 TaxID=3082949 RepID=UPI00385151FB
MPQVSIAELVAAARAGQLVGFPTDTVPALAAVPEAAASIYAAKQRAPEKPLILMAATAEDLWPFVRGDVMARARWKAIAAKYWPGALTLVLPKGDRVPNAVNPENPTSIGIRVPNWPLALAILQQTGPLATTSLNRSGQPPLENLIEIAEAFPSVVTPPMDLWELPLGQDRVPSTVAQWKVEGWTILRQGSVRLEP